MAVQFTKLSVSPEVVQTTGTSETAVMSQKAVTDALANAGGGSGGGLVLKSINVSDRTNQFYSNLRALINKGVYHIEVVMTATSDALTVSCIKNTIDTSTGTHTKTTENKSILSSGNSYLFKLSKYSSTEITLTSSFGPSDFFISLTFKSDTCQIYYHNYHTYSNIEYNIYGNTTLGTLVNTSSKIYYYDTE